MTNPAVFATTLAERIATVAMARASGAWGTYTNMGHGRAIVDADGVRAVISGDAHGWLVAIVGGPAHFVAGAAYLEDAVAMALEAK